MKKRTRLFESEARELGFKVKVNDKGRNQARYFLDENQLDILKRLRNKGSIEVHKNIKIEPKYGKHYWQELRDENGKKKGNVFVKNPFYIDESEQKKMDRFKEVVDSFKEELPVSKPVNPPSFKGNNLCNQYTITDYHLGMMSWAEETGADWDLKIAEETLIKFFETSICQSPLAGECVLAQIGDFLHWDGLDAVTPASKHVLDADTRFTKLVRVAIRLLRKIIKMLLEKYPKVTLIMAEGNHDTASSVWLKEVFSSFYEEEPRLFIDNNPDPYYCFIFGKTCLFYHHGHKKKLNNIDSVFVSKFKKQFGNSEYVYAHTGHLHHERVLENNLMVLEQHRTLAAKDAYASRGGWLSGRDSKVITYHRDYGEVARQTININMLH